MAEQYYWVDEGSNFGGGDSPVKYGDKMPKDFEKDERFESFKDEGNISTEPVAGKRQLSELEQLRQEVKVLKNEKSEMAKAGSGDGITKAQLDEAKAESAQADLDLIGLVIDSVENIQVGDKKEEIWDAVKSIKDLLKEGE